MAGLQHNKQSAFEQLVLNYSQQMYVISYQYLNNDADSKDCVQKAFLQVVKYIRTFRADSSLKTWLHRITVNCALMTLRNNKKTASLSLESTCHFYHLQDEQTEHNHEATPTLEQYVETLELQKSIQALILLLPQNFSTLIQLRYIQELNTKETAAILALSEGAVKTQLHRARACLKRLIEQTGVESTKCLAY